jgi:competence protein ComEC
VLAADPVRSVNDNSLVLELRFAGRTVLLTGDLEAEGEAELTAARRAAGAGRVDVVKVPHHGSATSSSPELVGALAPALAVISCGRGNSFGLPAASVIAAWAAAGAEIARTDRDGAVTVTISADGALAVDRAARAGPAPRAPALPGAERAAAP